MATMSSITERQIMIAMDARNVSEENLAVLAQIASRLNAPLSGLFVEDSRLLDAARLSFAIEVCSQTGEEKKLETETLARLNRQFSARARQLLEKLAQLHQIPWSFTVEAGELISKALARRGVDVFFPARLQRAGEKRVLHGGHQQLVLFYEKSPQFERAVEVLKQLSAHDFPLEVVVVTEIPLPKDVIEQIDAVGVSLRVQRVAGLDLRALRLLHVSATALVMLPKHRLRELAPAELSGLAALFSCPVYLLD